jgi:DNA-binding PadR family transcriptional regulator
MPQPYPARPGCARDTGGPGWHALVVSTSTLGYAILGLLAREACSGYQLAARLRTPTGYYWTARHSQIYPELERLLAAGLVSYRSEAGPGPREKKVYAPTGAGLAALREWVTRPPAPYAPRDELLLKTYSLSLADPVAAAALYRKQADEHAERLAEFQAIRERALARHGGAAPPLGSPEFGSYATLLLGIGHERDHLAWCRWLIESLERGAVQDEP